MHRLSMTNPSSSIRGPLDKASPKIASVDQLVETMKSLGNHPDNTSSVIAFRNCSPMTTSPDLQRFFGGWAKVEHFPTCRNPLEGGTIGRVNKKKNALDEKKMTPDLSLRKNVRTDNENPMPQCSSTKNGQAPWLRSIKRQAPPPPSQAAVNSTDTPLINDVNSGTDVVTTKYSSHHKKGFFYHLKVMWKRVDLPLIDILSSKY